MKRLLRRTSYLFLVAGLAAVGWCAYVWIDAELFQQTELEELRRLEDKLRESRPVAGRARAPDSLIGRLEIPRIGLSAVVVEGVDAQNLRRAVGHMPGTALPGDPGNVVVAGHRDTFFRPLRNIRPDDVIALATVDGLHEYRVESTEIVGPDDVQVLAASSTPTLTLITCYPFYYIGPVPKRFIVRARQVG